MHNNGRLQRSILLSLLFALPTHIFPSSVRCNRAADPCEQARPAVEKANIFLATALFSSALHSISDSALADPLHEHIVSFGKDTEGEIIVSPIATGGKSSSMVPRVANAFADLHNHPNHTPPSSGDLYGLLQQFKKDKNYCMRFVFDPSGVLYALAISDTAAANLFWKKFPSQQTAGYSPLFPDSLLTEYRDIIYRYGAKEELAMAYMLEKYVAGVSLLKQEKGGNFKMLRTRFFQVDGQWVFAPTYCP